MWRPTRTLTHGQTTNADEPKRKRNRAAAHNQYMTEVELQHTEIYDRRKNLEAPAELNVVSDNRIDDDVSQ